MNVNIIGGNGGEYGRLFLSLGHTLVVDFAKADLIVFTGGADVSPEYYGDNKHPATVSGMYRDEMESVFFKAALELKIPMVGICRGGQFLNVMSGGRMYQHVTKHCRTHEITDLQTGERTYVSSTHHQMMMPSPKGILVASSTLGGTREWYDGEIFKKDVSTEDIEVVYYPHTQCLCFQPHPEFMSKEYAPMRKYFESLLERFLIKEEYHV